MIVRDVFLTRPTDRNGKPVDEMSCNPKDFRVHFGKELEEFCKKETISVRNKAEAVEEIKKVVKAMLNSNRYGNREGREFLYRDLGLLS